MISCFNFSYESFQLIKKLALPDFKNGTTILSMNFRYSSLIGESPDADRIRNVAEAGLHGHGLRSINDDSIIIVDLELECPGYYHKLHESDESDESVEIYYHHCYSLVTHRRSLRKIAESDVGIIKEERVDLWKMYGRDFAIPWVQWGPPVTRWQNDMNTRLAGSSSACSGCRHAIFPVLGSNRGITGNIIVRDYNPFTVKDVMAKANDKKRGKKRQSNRKEKNRVEQNVPTVITATSAIHEPDIFFEDVLSSLPYVETEMKCSGTFDVLMDDDRVLVISVSSSRSKR